MLNKCQKSIVLPMKSSRLTTTSPSPSPLTVCPLHTSPCVRSTRPRVCRHHAHMLKHVCAWCRYTRGRVDWTHGFFQRVTHRTHTHTTPQHKTQHTTTHTNNTTTTLHENRDRQRQRERETEKEDGDRKSREERKRQCGGAWPFLVDGVLCLVNPVNDRVF